MLELDLNSLSPDEAINLLNSGTLTKAQEDAIINEYFPPAQAAVPDFRVDNTETGFEIEAFGIVINDKDDIFSVGFVLAIVVIGYVVKSMIDYWFAKRLERYKLKIESGNHT